MVTGTQLMDRIATIAPPVSDEQNAKLASMLHECDTLEILNDISQPVAAVAVGGSLNDLALRGSPAVTEIQIPETAELRDGYWVDTETGEVFDVAGPVETQDRRRFCIVDMDGLRWVLRKKRGVEIDLIGLKAMRDAETASLNARYDALMRPHLARHSRLCALEQQASEVVRKHMAETRAKGKSIETGEGAAGFRMSGSSTEIGDREKALAFCNEHCPDGAEVKFKVSVIAKSPLVPDGVLLKIPATEKFYTDTKTGWGK